MTFQLASRLSASISRFTYTSALFPSYGFLNHEINAKTAIGAVIDAISVKMFLCQNLKRKLLLAPPTCITIKVPRL